jgi:hypothetical protein
LIQPKNAFALCLFHAGGSFNADASGRAVDMHLIPAAPCAALDGYIGYFEPYATSHEALDQDHDFQAVNAMWRSRFANP